MRSKLFYYLIAMIIVGAAPCRAAFIIHPLHPVTAIAPLQTADPELSLAGYSYAKTNAVMPLTAGPAKVASASTLVPYHKWCVVHKIGFYTILTGVALVGTGIVLAGTAPKSNSFGSDQAWQALGFMVLGLLVTLIATPFLIGGSIHDNINPKVTVVSPKPTEIGLAYRF
jgi:hypothetical protein